MTYKTDWEQEKIDRALTAAQTVRFGISFLDDAMSGLMSNEVWLIGARTGAGKTELATHLAYEQAKAGRRVAFFALEASQWEIHQRIKYRELARIYFNNYKGQFQFPRFREWINEIYNEDFSSWERIVDKDLVLTTDSLRLIYKTDKYTPQQFARELETIAPEVDMVVLDHLHFFDTSGESEMEGIKQAIHQIRRCVLQFKKPILCIAHLRKKDRGVKNENPMPNIDDFHGHSDLSKVSENVLLMAHASGEQFESIGSRPTYFHICKSRTAGEVTNYVGVVGYNLKTNSYSEKYYLATPSLFGPPEIIESRDKIPFWAKHAILPAHPQKPKMFGGGYVPD